MQADAMTLCAICHDTVGDDEGTRLECGHHFHTSCLLQWAISETRSHDSCPMCRRPLVQDSDTVIGSERGLARDYTEVLVSCKGLFMRFYKLLKLFNENKGDDALSRRFRSYTKKLDKVQARLKRHKERLREFTKAHKTIIKQEARMRANVRRADQDFEELRRLVVNSYEVETYTIFSRHGSADD